MIETLDDYDWGQAFGYACGSACISTAPGSSCSANEFTREDVSELRHATAGEHDESNWMAAGVLSDGRCFYLEAGCDYTGWDCQASGFAVVADDWEALVQFGMGDNARTAWGLG